MRVLRRVAHALVKGALTAKTLAYRITNACFPWWSNFFNEPSTDLECWILSDGAVTASVYPA